MAKYIVSMAVDGRIDVEVEAESTKEAFKAAIGAFIDADLEDMEVIDAKPVNVSDEDGNLLEEYNG
jgi:hypothetical protein